jgi:TetR/AcrR family transcriptional regulator
MDRQQSGDESDMARIKQNMSQPKNIRKLGKQTREVSKKTKKTILKAALTVFAREGFSKAKLRDIADLAGTTHGLIRHHFGTKDDLWKAMVDYGLQLQEDNLRKIATLTKSEDPVELFREFITSYISTMAKHPELSSILLHDNSKNSPHLNYTIEREKRLYAFIEPFFKNAQACGYFKGFDHLSFNVYVRALVETPIATMDLSNQQLKHDIRSEKGIAMHTERVLKFLFHKET